MKKHVILAVIFSALFVMQAMTADVPEGLPAANGEAFWVYISETSPYSDWGTWPGHPGIYPGKSPHGSYLKLYANEIALKAAKEGKSMPYGSILVKENYAKNKKTLMAVTPMYKVHGYNPDKGDWFWAKYGPAGKTIASGKVEGCITCHSVRKTQDWIFTQPR